jgi:hypothetical protein
MTVNFINSPNLKLLAEVWAEIVRRKEEKSEGKN